MQPFLFLDRLRLRFRRMVGSKTQKLGPVPSTQKNTKLKKSHNTFAGVSFHEKAFGSMGLFRIMIIVHGFRRSETTENSFVRAKSDSEW